MAYSVSRVQQIPSNYPGDTLNLPTSSLTSFEPFGSMSFHCYKFCGLLKQNPYSTAAPPKYLLQ